MNINEKIENYLKNNDYNSKGLTDFITNSGYDRRYKAVWLASTTNNDSGIIRYQGQKYYFSCIKPWPYCPEGNITVEKM